MSIVASWMIFAVIMLRLLLRKAPKYLRCILWGLVAVRLICPIHVESSFSLVPSIETVTTHNSHLEYADSKNISISVSTGINTMDDKLNDYLGKYYYKNSGITTNVENEKVNIIDIISNVWIVGVVILLSYSVIVYLKIKHRVATSIRLKGNIWISDDIESPFILGIFRPKIYLPSGMNEQEKFYVIEHERVHLKRCDHLWKPLAFVLLAIYWFNPIIWIAYILLCRDIELACDERVIKDMSVDDKKEYSKTLLSCSVSHKMVAACPVAFGEVAVKGRVKSVLNYKKPAFWFLSVAIVACILLSICFLTNPKTYADENDNKVDVIKKEDEKIVDNNDTSLVVNTDNEESEILIYYADNDMFETRSWIMLTTVENTYKIQYNSGGSRFSSGTYEMTEDKLVLTDYDEPDRVYSFDIDDGVFIFDYDNSSELDLWAHKIDGSEHIGIGMISLGEPYISTYKRYIDDDNYIIETSIQEKETYRLLEDENEYNYIYELFTDNFGIYFEPNRE